MTKRENGGAAATIDDIASIANAVTVLVPTRFEPHLCVMKRGKDDKAPRREHGVTFRRAGTSVFMEAMNNVVTVSILLPGDQKLPAEELTVPAELMAMVAAAAAEEIELVSLTFAPPRVVARIGNATHDYPLIQPDLPFEGRHVRDLGCGRRGGGATQRIDALALAKVQRALDADSLELRKVTKGLVALVPDGDDAHGSFGYLHAGSGGDEE